MQMWESVPWMTSWSSPVIDVNKEIPLSANQLIEKFTGTQVKKALSDKRNIKIIFAGVGTNSAIDSIGDGEVPELFSTAFGFNGSTHAIPVAGKRGSFVRVYLNKKVSLVIMLLNSCDLFSKYSNNTGWDCPYTGLTCVHCMVLLRQQEQPQHNFMSRQSCDKEAKCYIKSIHL